PSSTSDRPSRRSIAPMAVLVGTFALVTAIQTVPSTLLHAQPFYNWQPKNVWFGIYGQGDWVVKWHSVPDDVSLLSVFALDPAAFVTHWWTEFTHNFISQTLWPLPLHLAWIVGSAGILMDQRMLLQR